MEQENSVIYGRLSAIKMRTYSWGSIGVLFSNWVDLKLSGFLVEFAKDTSYHEWVESQAENLCVVEEGAGALWFNGAVCKIEKGFAFKVFPEQDPVIKPKNNLKILSIQMPVESRNEKYSGEDLTKLKIIDPADIPEKVYEYETLGQEIVTCKYEKGLGLIRFQFPIDRIPIHRHPFSGRLIRTISGKGYCYVKPRRYEMDEDTFVLFPKGITHTNGPLTGHINTLWAFQLPWVDSKIDEENIAGDEAFVRYVESTPPKPLWKTKEDFLRAIDKLSK
ncbi:MAG: hypothetical protein HY514_00835 [Candidatus Aenigmarchaeota archaeon]|nr:hypothetical protein [Candidatus Aenigmarchaeota archaeon]